MIWASYFNLFTKLPNRLSIWGPDQKEVLQQNQASIQSVLPLGSHDSAYPVVLEVPMTVGDPKGTLSEPYR